MAQRVLRYPIRVAGQKDRRSRDKFHRLSRTQNPRALWSAGDRLERYWDNGIKQFFFDWSPA